MCGYVLRLCIFGKNKKEKVRIAMVDPSSFKAKRTRQSAESPQCKYNTHAACTTITSKAHSTFTTNSVGKGLKGKSIYIPTLYRSSNSEGVVLE